MKKVNFIKKISSLFFVFLILIFMFLNTSALDILEWEDEDVIPYDLSVGRIIELYDDYDNGGFNAVYTFDNSATTLNRLYNASINSDDNFYSFLAGGIEAGDEYGYIVGGLYNVSEVPSIEQYPIYNADFDITLKQYDFNADVSTDNDVIRRIKINYDNYFTTSVFNGGAFDCPSTFKIESYGQPDYSVRVDFDVVKYSLRPNDTYTGTVEVYEEVYSFHAERDSTYVEPVYFNINNYYNWRLGTDVFNDFDSFTSHPFGYEIRNLTVEIVFGFGAFSSTQPNTAFTLNEDYCTIDNPTDRNGFSTYPNQAYSNALFEAMEINDELAHIYYTGNNTPNPLLGVISFVSDTVSGFFDIDFFGFGWTFGTLFAVIAMILMAIIALKIFGGG